MISVSVIIPCYNRESIIKDTIDNVLNQELKPVEIIVVDDGSTDNSVEVIKTYGDRVILITQSNRGPGAARNAGLKIATGEYIQFMDSDDFMSLNKLSVQAEILQKTKADIVYGPWVKVWISSEGIRLQDVVLQQKALPASNTPLKWFLRDWSMVFQQCLVRRTVLNEVNGYNETIYSLEDADLFVRLMLLGATMVHENKTLTFYRLDDFGKLTESGLNKARRLKDQLIYYNLLYAYASSNSILQANMGNMVFKKKVSLLLREIGPEILEKEYEYLKGIKLNYYFYKLLDLCQQKKSGIQKRIKGHRWPVCFQAGKLSFANRNQIKQLNWVLLED